MTAAEGGEGLRGFFLTVLRMSITGSLVILAVLPVRLCLKKAPKRWSWALWLIVLFRLLTPFGIPVSVALPDFTAQAEAAPVRAAAFLAPAGIYYPGT